MLYSRVAVIAASACVITLAGYAVPAYASSHTVSAQLIDDSLVGYGDYGRDLLAHAYFTIHGEIRISFIDKIDRSSIDLDRVHLIGCVGDDCVIFPLAGQKISEGTEYVTMLAVALPHDVQDVLQSDMRLSVVLQDGAYTSREGNPNPPESTGVRMIGESYPQLIERVQYEPDRNELTLLFSEAINTDSIHESYIKIITTDSLDHFTLSGQEPVRVAEDKTHVVYGLAQQYRDKLLAATYPSINIQHGAYERASDRLAAFGVLTSIEIRTPYSEDPRGEWLADRLLIVHGQYKRDDNRIAMLATVTEFESESRYTISQVPVKSGASAHYTTDDNMLALDLGEEIDRFSIYASRIHIYDDSKIISMSASEFVRVGDDERSIFFELSPHNRYVMSFMAEPSILLGPGAFRTHAGVTAGVTESDARRVPLEMSGDAVFLLDPTVPTGVLLGRAEYSLARDTATLVLHFREAIDVSLINTDFITIVNDGCSGMALSDWEIVSVGKDKKSVVFGIDVSDVMALRDMRSAWVRLEQGAFATAANGTVNNAGDVPLYNSLFLPPNNYQWTPPIPTLRIPCLITYSVQSPSAVLSEDDYGRGFIDTYTKTVMSAVRDGLNAWSKSNPDITLKRITTGTPAVIVKWHEPNDAVRGNFGYGFVNCLHHQCKMSMILEYRDCQGGMTVLDYDIIRNVIAHEFGHNLGLDHHHSYDHLMYGSDHNVQVPFDDLGYNMPRLPSRDTVYEDVNWC